MTCCGQVDANLVGAAGFGACSEQGCGIGAAVESVEDEELRYRCARIVRMNRHPLSLGGVASHRPGNSEAVARHDAADERQVGLVDRAVLELLRERHPGEG